MRIRPNQEIPNQILDSQPPSKYCDKIKNQILHKYIYADDNKWLGFSWINYNKVIFGKFILPTL